MTPPPFPSNHPPLLPNNFVFEPMPNAESPISLLENLLKHPGRVVHELHQKQAPILAGWLLIFGIIGVAIYGTVVGAPSGGAPMWIAPAKLGLGTLLAGVVFFPRLFNFTPPRGGCSAQPQLFRVGFSSRFFLNGKGRG